MRSGTWTPFVVGRLAAVQATAVPGWSNAITVSRNNDLWGDDYLGDTADADWVPGTCESWL